MIHHNLIPGDRLLPHYGVMDRLAFYDSDAPRKIIDRAQQIGEQRRNAPQDDAGVWRAALRGIASLFGGAAEYKAPVPAAISINRAWAAAGDDMRQAIAEYMEEHRLTADRIGLRPEQRASLEPVLRQRANADPSP
jgi:hypothetical protein